MPIQTSRNKARAKAARARRIFRGQRDRLRGFSISWKFLAVSVVTELTVIASSLFAAYVFAQKYAGPLSSHAPVPDTTTAPATHAPAIIQVTSLDWLLPASFPNLADLANLAHGHSLDWWMAVTGGIVVAVAELTRLPLVAAFRVHRSGIMRAAALLGVILCCVITAKALAIVQLQAYVPRLYAVQQATSDLHLAEADLAIAGSRQTTASDTLQPLQARVDEANRRIEELNARISEQGQAPKPVCSRTQHRDRKTGRRWMTTSCSTPRWAGQQFADQLDAAIAERNAATTARDAATRSLNAEAGSTAAANATVAALRDRQRAAVNDSQVHQLVAMVFRKDPVDVSEEQVHVTLLIIVLIPAVFAAITSSILAAAAFSSLSRRRATEVPRSEDGTLAAFVKDTARRAVAIPAPYAVNTNLSGASK